MSKLEALSKKQEKTEKELEKYKTLEKETSVKIEKIEGKFCFVGALASVLYVVVSWYVIPSLLKIVVPFVESFLDWLGDWSLLLIPLFYFLPLLFIFWIFGISVIYEKIKENLLESNNSFQKLKIAKEKYEKFIEKLQEKNKEIEKERRRELRAEGRLIIEELEALHGELYRKRINSENEEIANLFLQKIRKLNPENYFSNEFYFEGEEKDKAIKFWNYGIDLMARMGNIIDYSETENETEQKEEESLLEERIADNEAEKTESKHDENIERNISEVDFSEMGEGRGDKNNFNRKKREFTPRKINFEKISRSKSELGLLGEEIILESEKNNLINSGREDLVGKIVHVSQELGDGAGYDIFSFDEKGNDKFIEVKTTRNGLRNQFYFSDNEKRFVEKAREKYYLYRLNLLNDEEGELLILRGDEIFNKFNFEPSQFVVKLKK